MAAVVGRMQEHDSDYAGSQASDLLGHLGDHDAY
jgi:hypothetical protein